MFWVHSCLWTPNSTGISSTKIMSTVPLFNGFVPFLPCLSCKRPFKLDNYFKQKLRELNKIIKNDLETLNSLQKKERMSWQLQKCVTLMINMVYDDVRLGHKVFNTSVAIEVSVRFSAEAKCDLRVNDWDLLSSFTGSSPSSLLLVSLCLQYLLLKLTIRALCDWYQS